MIENETCGEKAMNKQSTYLLACAFLAGISLASSVHATSYSGHVDSYWVEASGDINWYMSDASGYQCRPTLFILRKSQQNFDELFMSLLLAMKQNYRVILEVTSCYNTYNAIDFGKVCSPQAPDC